MNITILLSLRYWRIRYTSQRVGNRIYYITPVCRVQGEGTWKPVMVENGKVSEIPAVITNLGVSFTIIEMKFELSEAAPAVVKNAPYTIIEDRELNIELRISNTGNIDYRAQIGVKAVSLADETKVFELAHAKAILPVGETTVVSLVGVINFREGNISSKRTMTPRMGKRIYHSHPPKLGVKQRLLNLLYYRPLNLINCRSPKLSKCPRR